MFSAPLLSLVLSAILCATPMLPAPQTPEDTAPAVEESAAPALSAEELTALAQTKASTLDAAALTAALPLLPHYDASRAERYLACAQDGSWTLEQVIRIVNTDNDLTYFDDAQSVDLTQGLRAAMSRTTL